LYTKHSNSKTVTVSWRRHNMHQSFTSWVQSNW